MADANKQNKDNRQNKQQELQEKVLAYRLLESRIDSLAKQREFLAGRLVELQTTVESIDEIEKSGEETLFPLGSEAYAFGKVIDKTKMVVEVGAGVALEKNIQEAKGILKGRMKDIQDALVTVQRKMQETSESMQMLEPEIQQMLENQQKEQGQGRQQPDMSDTA
jgi:prefoldin alpha subunit